MTYPVTSQEQKFSFAQLTIVCQVILFTCLVTIFGCGQRDNIEQVENIKSTKFGREDTVFFDHEGGPIPDPHNLNPLVPSPIGPGMRQSFWEPLFILNYETGEIESWIGDSFTSNDQLDIGGLSVLGKFPILRCTKLLHQYLHLVPSLDLNQHLQ